MTTDYDIDIEEQHDTLVSLGLWAEHDLNFPNCGCGGIS